MVDRSIIKVNYIFKVKKSNMVKESFDFNSFCRIRSSCQIKLTKAQNINHLLFQIETAGTTNEFVDI
jgi:hypothetical protein